MAKGKDPRRPLLISGLALLATAIVLYAASFSVPWLYDWVTWFALAATLVLVVYFVVRRAATAPDTDKHGSTLFQQSTMMGDVEKDKPD